MNDTFVTDTILQFPDERLRKTCEEFPINIFKSKSDEAAWIPKFLRSFVKMFDLMYATAPSGVGLAAPQAGWLTRAFIMNCSMNQDVGSERVFLNPTFTPLPGPTEVDEEGCLSLTGQFYPVERPASIVVNATVIEGRDLREALAKGRKPRLFTYKNQKVTGLKARVFMHEIDHFSGILFVDRVVEQLKANANG